MKMRHEDAGHAGGSHIGKNELPLGALTWIKQKTFSIPAKEIGAMVAQSGRLLTRTAQNR